MSLEEVFFPSMVICNMNTLRRSFIYTIIEDPKLKAMNVTFTELHKIVHLVFIAGEDLVLTEREKAIVEGRQFCYNTFIILLHISTNPSYVGLWSNF